MRFTKLFASVRFLYRRLNYGKVVTRTCSSGSGGGENKGCCVCVYEKDNKLELTPVGAELDQKCGGKISEQLNILSCELQVGKAFAITNILDYSAVAITCIGPKDACYNALESLDEARENVRWGVGAGVRLLKQRGCGDIEVDPCSQPDAAAEAAELAAWRYEVFKSPEIRKPPCKVCECGGQASQLWCAGAVRGGAQNWARWLADMPANRMAPVDLAQAALDVLCPLGVVVEAHDREWVQAQRMRAFLAVAKGSCDTPMFLDCSYKGAGPSVPPVLLAAKGVTFDSGGLCLKGCHSMLENRGSMAGAAVVLAALQAVARLKVPINVSAVIPICENMVSGQCMKVGDVVRALNGLSIQIENTDMEGRLMMADALVYGQSKYKPSLVIDVATFTHGVLMATGGGAFGCFSNSAAAWRAVRCAGACSGDRPWRFPLWQYFQNQITNEASVDLRNKGSGHATPCLGAAFLKNFICSDWVHMDITGVGKVAHSGAPPYLDTRRMTGRPTRTLAALLQQLAAASQAEPQAQPQASQPCTKSPPQDSQPCTSSPQGSQPCTSSSPQGSQQCTPSSPPYEPSKAKPCPPKSSGPNPCAPSPQDSRPNAPSPKGSQPCTPSPRGSQSNAPTPPGLQQGIGVKPQICAPSQPRPSSPHGSQPSAPTQSSPTHTYKRKPQCCVPSTQSCTTKPQSCVPTKHKCS